MTNQAEPPTNWGRCSPEDERGTLNLISDEVRASAVAEARSGRTVSLSRPLTTTPLRAGPTPGVPATSTSALQVAMHTGPGPGAMAELLILVPHAPDVTHFDSPPKPSSTGGSSRGGRSRTAGMGGLRHGSTAIFADEVITRGALLDLAPGGEFPAGHPVPPATSGMPSPPLEATLRSPLHAVGRNRFGMPLIDGADPTDLVIACAEEGRCSFLFVAGPPRLHLATGVSVEPARHL